MLGDWLRVAVKTLDSRHVLSLFTLSLVSLLQGLKVWLNIKNQLYPATVTSATANDVAFATEYGEVNLIIEIMDRKLWIE